jgi:Spy/CpxP family protein refolding chaperone
MSRASELTEDEMKALSRWVMYGSVAGALTLSACGSSVDADSAALAQGEMAESPPEVAHMGLLREALAKVSLRAEQRPTVEQLGREAQARHEPIKQARALLRGALADQVAAGKIDRTALKPQLDALLSAIEQSRAGDRVALGRLHDILDKDQRSQFVDAIEAEFHGNGHHPHGGPGGLRRWASDLNLTDQQAGQIRAALKAKFAGQRDAMKEQLKSMREQGKRMLEAFRQDQFTLDANAPLFGRDKAERRIERMLDVAEAAVPLLTPEQRAIAAQKLRTRGGKL